MNSELRRAWTEIINAEDYERHMTAIGQAQAAAGLNRYLIARSALPAGSRIAIAGAGTGQIFDFLDPEIFRPYRLTCADLNLAFLVCLGKRLARHGMEAEIVVDDFERTSLAPGPDLLLITLLLEHIDWQRGVKAVARLKPAHCGLVIQENPPGMATAVTPGRRLPSSLAQALKTAHPTLVPRDRLIAAMAAEGYGCEESAVLEVADGKQLVGLLFAQD